MANKKYHKHFDNNPRFKYYDEMTELYRLGTPLPIAKRVVFVSKGSEHTCFITIDNELYGLGNNRSKQIVDIGGTFFKEPIKMADNVKKVICMPGKTYCICYHSNLHISGLNEFNKLTHIMDFIKDIDYFFLNKIVMTTNDNFKITPTKPIHDSLLKDYSNKSSNIIRCLKLTNNLPDILLKNTNIYYQSFLYYMSS